jgi:hypothetical protein
MDLSTGQDLTLAPIMANEDMMPKHQVCHGH